MKKILILCTLLTSIMLVSFQQDKKIIHLKNGNFIAKKPVTISETDAKTLFDMTKNSKSETTVVHQTIWKHKDANNLKYKGVILTSRSPKSIVAAASETTVVHETIWQHKDASKLKLKKEEIAYINTIMAKY